jgi:hypothetical protein
VVGEGTTYVSLVVSLVSKFSSALTRTTLRPGPSTWSSTFCAAPLTRSSYFAVCSSVSFAADAEAPPPVPPEDSSLPLESVTVTSAGSRFSTLPATSRVTESTWLRSSVTPGCSARSTDAVGLSSSVENTSCFGSARWTTAVFTPSIACSVRLSSPSSARRKATFCWKSVAVMPCWSRIS